jgi:GNAT superfamily N-acetyltransferase
LQDAPKIDVRRVSEYPESVFRDLVARNLEAEHFFFPAWKLNGPGDPTYQSSGEVVRIAAFLGDTLVGLSWGQAVTKFRFHMFMSLVEPEFRRQGIYSRMLALVLELTRQFDEVDSYHHVLNNPVIVGKLKAGFQIIGFETLNHTGPALRLRYFHNQKLRRLMEFRMGLHKQLAPL